MVAGWRGERGGGVVVGVPSMADRVAREAEVVPSTCAASFEANALAPVGPGRGRRVWVWVWVWVWVNRVYG